MQHLTPVGLSPDGKNLVLVGDTGEEFVVPVDHRLRTTLRGDHARPVQLEMKMESALRPRDIQARIRAGESAEEVAAAAQTTVEAIMAFAAPVLAERAHVAQTALKCSIRRATTAASPGARTLDDASRIHLSNLSVRADDVEWDAWRREDGRWALVAEYIAGDDLHRAEFIYDQPGRYVLAEDEEARLLTGEATLRAEPAPEAPGRRLTSVPTSSVDELPLGDDALALVREDPVEQPVEQPTEPAAEQASEHPPEPIPEPAAAFVAEPEPWSPDSDDAGTTDLTETVAAVRAVAAEPDVQGTFDDLAADHADADWIATVTEVPASEAPITADPIVENETEPAESAESVPEEPAAQAPVPSEEPPARKKGRSSVPSWDEIMFGGGGKHE